MEEREEGWWFHVVEATLYIEDEGGDLVIKVIERFAMVLQH